MSHINSSFSVLAPSDRGEKSAIPFIVVLAVELAVMMSASPLYADTSLVWDRAAYWDGRYPSGWAGGGEAVRDTLEYAGYEVLNANQLKTWMDARIADGIPSVVVFCRDIAPDTVVESLSSTCTLRRYLDAGGKIVWYADIPMYYQGHANGSRTVWDIGGAVDILGFNAADGSWDSRMEVVFTYEGARWGLTETWQSVRPTSGYGLRVLARDTHGYAAAWVHHYVPDDTYRGFVRLFDRPGQPNLDDLRRVAEYPHVPEPIAWDNQAENEDDIVGVFFYPWYENPNASGQWRHWNDGYSPPATWAACYLPNYPDSMWNPSVQLYDSKDTQVLRWQDRAMARAGVDIAVASWWGVSAHEDARLAKAIRTCKSVQWCIYYEMEAYGDPTAQKIHDDIKYVVDTYGPTRNYARIDGKWLVLVYGAGGDETANRWRQAKALLARDGYHVYLNGDGSSGREPWDAVHSYDPVVYHGHTQALPDVDDSAWISPGFYSHGEENPRLKRSLSEFASAWNRILANRNRFRFILIETWNEWHEGTQIESGQEIIRDPQGFRPKIDGDYGYAFIDAIAPATLNDLHWRSSGHRLVAPVRVEAEEMIWDDDRKVLQESPTECRITEADTRIGSSILVPNSGDAAFTVQARAVIRKAGRSSNGPELMLYLDDIDIQRWRIGSSSYEDHSATVPIPKGIHKLELAMTEEPVGADWDIVVDFVDVDVVQVQNPITIEYQVSSSEEDGYASNESLQNLDGAYLRVGASSFAEPPYYVCGMVFRNVDIPQGAKIISAYLKIRSYNNRLTDIVHGKIEAEAADSVGPFGSSRQMGSVPRTSASVNWDHSEPWAQDTWYTSPNIATVIQEVINRGGWSPTNGSLAVLYSTREHEGGNRNISSYDRSGDYAPKLEITYAP